MLSPHPRWPDYPARITFLYRTTPAFFLCLRHTADGKGVFTNIARDCSPRSNGRAFTYRDRSHQLSVGTDKHIIADNGFEFIRTVIVAGNRTRTDIDVIADFRIAG